jgi:hypothetical protein
MSRECGTRGENRNTHRVLMGTQDEMRSLGIATLTWEDNIKIDLKSLDDMHSSGSG